MATYCVTVRRSTREDCVIEVEADSQEAAIEKANLESTNIPIEKWECYDCEYDTVEDDDCTLMTEEISI